MKPLLLAFLFCASSLHAAVTPGASATCGAATNSTLACTNATSFAVNASDLVFVFLYPTITSYSIDDNCQQNWQLVNSNGITGWYALPAKACPQESITIARTSGTEARFQWVAQVYSGVQSLGATKNGTSGGAGTCQVVVNPTLAGNWELTGWKINNNSDFAVTPGTLRVHIGYAGGASGSQAGVFLYDMNAPSTASITFIGNWTSATYSAYCTPGGVELVAGTAEPPPPPSDTRPALATDNTRSVLLASASILNYQLPSSSLSATHTWCAWVMPTGAATNNYALTVQSPATLNNQTGSMALRSWQMSRVCQNASNNYFAEPPFVEGPGIHFTPTATGVSISTAGIVGSGLTRINGGTTVLGDGVTQVPANSCVTLYNTTASTTPSAVGVLQSDVVTFSQQSQPTGWGNGALHIRPEAYDGSISWRVCNSRTDTAFTPTALNVNWYVAR